LTRTLNRVCCRGVHDTNTRINSPIPFQIQRYLPSENLKRVPLGLFGITGFRAYVMHDTKEAANIQSVFQKFVLEEKLSI